MQQVGTIDDPEVDILKLDLLGAPDRFCQCRVIGITELSGPGEASGLKLDTRDLGISSHGHSDIERGAGFGLMDLEGHATNNGVWHWRLCEDSGKC